MRSETEAMVILSYTSNGNSPQNFDIEPISSSTAAAIKSFKFEIYMRFIFYDDNPNAAAWKDSPTENITKNSSYRRASSQWL